MKTVLTFAIAGTMLLACGGEESPENAGDDANNSCQSEPKPTEGPTPTAKQPPNVDVACEFDEVLTTKGCKKEADLEFDDEIVKKTPNDTTKKPPADDDPPRPQQEEGIPNPKGR